MINIIDPNMSHVGIIFVLVFSFTERVLKHSNPILALLVLLTETIPVILILLVKIITFIVLVIKVNSIDILYSSSYSDVDILLDGVSCVFLIISYLGTFSKLFTFTHSRCIQAKSKPLAFIDFALDWFFDTIYVILSFRFMILYNTQLAYPNILIMIMANSLDDLFTSYYFKSNDDSLTMGRMLERRINVSDTTIHLIVFWTLFICQFTVMGWLIFVTISIIT
jgi:hypothetical protein